MCSSDLFLFTPKEVKKEKGGVSFKPNTIKNVVKDDAEVKKIKNAKVGDVILLAGKGHENYQEIAGVKYPFSDIEQAQQFLRERAA